MDDKKSALLVAAVQKIQENWWYFKDTQKSVIAFNNRIASLIARMMGYTTDKTEVDEATGKKIYEYACTVRDTLYKNGTVPKDKNKIIPIEVAKDTVEALSELLLANKMAIDAFKVAQQGYKSNMVSAMKYAPPAVLKYIEDTVGVCKFTVAKIIGEAGDPRNFSNLHKYWVFLSVGFIRGHRQGSPVLGQKGIKDADAWKEERYVPKRRAISYAITDSALFAINRKLKAKEVTLSDPRSKYARVCRRYKAYYDKRVPLTEDVPMYTGKKSKSGKDIPHPDKWTPARCNNASKRVVAREIIRDIWVTWTGNEWGWSADTCDLPDFKPPVVLKIAS